MSNEANTTFRIFVGLFCLCCISHFTTHLGSAQFSHPSWWLACAIVGAASFCLHRFSFRRFFLLLTLQLGHVLVDAPFNPDHWLLLLFVNLLFQISALQLWLSGKRWTETDLFETVTPAIRCTFLICYGFAAFAKLNTHFLVSDSSCASELAEFQASVSPWLKYVMVPSLAGWMTVLCESSVALLLIPRRTRRYGVLVGVLFHTILVASPAIAVFDFTMVVYTMLFLFAGTNVGDRLLEKRRDFWQQIPALQDSVAKLRTYVLLLIPILMVARSLYEFQLRQAGLESFQDYWVGLSKQFTWVINMLVAVVVISLTISTLFGKDRNGPQVSSKSASRTDSRAKLEAFFFPKPIWQFLILGIAVLNGACPYLGLKTQGSFTMFSNLRTEGEHWNHLIAPRWMRVVDEYQTELLHVKSVDDARLQRDFVEENCLVPLFEVRRAAAINPAMAMTMLRDGHEVKLNPVSLDAQLASPLSFLEKKLLIFRPVTADGSPYCGN